MKTKELRELTKDELSARRHEIKTDLLNMRIQQASGQLENPSRLKIMRKEVARIQTILHERALNINVASTAAKPAKSKAEAVPKEAAPKKKAAAKKESSDKPATKKAASKKATKSKAAEA